MSTLTKEYRKNYYEKNKERIKQQNEETRKRNPEAARARVRKFSRTLKGRFATYKGNAKVRNLDFELSYEEFLEIANSSCYYCNDKGFGVDRVDSNKGYLKDNCVPCCSRCNLMKQDSSKDEFIEQCIKIANTWKRTALSTF